MSRRFNGLHARDYHFQDGTNSRDVIALYAGDRPIAFLEYGEGTYKLINQVHDLSEAHERKEPTHE